MAAHSSDTKGFSLDLFAPKNEQRILDSNLVLSETIDFAVTALPYIKPQQQASLKRAIQYITALQQRQAELHAKRLETFEAEQHKYNTYLNKRKHGNASNK